MFKEGLLALGLLVAFGGRVSAGTDDVTKSKPDAAVINDQKTGPNEAAQDGVFSFTHWSTVKHCSPMTQCYLP